MMDFTIGDSPTLVAGIFLLSRLVSDLWTSCKFLLLQFDFMSQKAPQEKLPFFLAGV